MQLRAVAVEGAVRRTVGNRTIFAGPVRGIARARSVEQLAVTVIGAVVGTWEWPNGNRTIWTRISEVTIARSSCDIAFAVTTTVTGTQKSRTHRTRVILVAFACAIDADSVSGAVERAFQNRRDIAVHSRPAGVAHARTPDALAVVMAVVGTASLVTRIPNPSIIALASSTVADSVSRTIHGAVW